MIGFIWTQKSSVHELVQLFASVLTRQQQDYFLLTPVEKVRIQVEDAAFLIVAAGTTGNSMLVLIATTNLGQQLLIGAEYPLFLQAQQDGQLLPYLQLWRGLTAKFSRNAYYQLVELAVCSGVQWQRCVADQLCRAQF